MKIFTTGLLITGLLLISCNRGDEVRETVLDRTVTIYDEIIYELPEVERWCDHLNLEREMVDVNGARLYLETEGEGIPMVLLHGGPGGTHHCFHPHFSRAAEFSQVIYYDQRGCGLSDYEPGDGYSIQQAADDLEKLRKKLDVDRWVVLGYSYGGLLAQFYATKYAQNIAGLVLVSPAICLNIELEPSRQDDYISSEEMERMREINEMPDLSREQRMYNRYLNGDWKRQHFYKPTREELIRFVRYGWVHDPGFRPPLIESVLNIDLRSAFTQFDIPTLIFEGKWDLTWNTDKFEKTASEHPNAKMVILERSGHKSFADEPNNFFNELKSFVDGLD